MRFIWLILVLCIPCLFCGCTTLEDYDLTPTVSVQAQGDAREPAESAAFLLTLNRTTLAPVTVNFSLSGTAEVGIDYVNPGTSIVIPGSASRAYVVIIPKKTGYYNRNRTIIFTITSVSSTAKLGTAQAAMRLLGEPIPGPKVPGDWTCRMKHDDLYQHSYEAIDPNATVPLTWSISSIPAGCTASIESESKLGTLLAFTPPRLTKGTFVLEIKVSNGSATTAFTQTIIVTNQIAYFTDWNPDPVITANTSILIDPDIQNEDHDPLSFYVPAGAGPRHGTVEILPSLKIRYTPTTDYVGVDSFTLGVTDQLDSREHHYIVTVSATAPATNN